MVRRIIPIVLTASLAVGGVAAAPVVPTASVPLAGETTLHVGAGIVALPVTLPDEATLDLSYPADRREPDDVSITNGGGLTAVVLRAVDDRAGLTAVRLPDDQSRAFDTVAVASGTNDVIAPTLPAGDYLLHLVSDDPGSVTIRFVGIPGTTDVDVPERTVDGTFDARVVAREVDGEIMRPNVEQDLRTPKGPGQTGVDSYGIGWHGTTRGTSTFVFDAIWFHGPEESAPGGVVDEPLLNTGHAERCSYGNPVPVTPQEPVTMAPVLFAPGCPGATGGNDVQNVFALRSARVILFGQTVGLPGMELARGGNIAHTGVFDPGMSGFWFDHGS